jgi:signal transduction histidine kinase
MSAPVLDAEGRAKLESLIADWRRENPNQYRVERVRLMDFAQHAGRVEEERAKAAGGILSNVKQATQTVDQALLLGERAVFMAHRMPFLVRLQGRVGAREMLSDAVSELRSPTSELMGRAEGLEPMVGTLTTLVERSADTTREARRLVEQVTPLSPSPEAMERLRDTITKADALTTHTTTMLQELHGLAGGGANGPGAMVSQRAEGLLKRAVLYLALLGGAWSMAWWGGYFIVKRRLARGS